MSRNIILGLIMGLCSIGAIAETGIAKTDVVARYTPVPVKIDGKMDEPEWNNAKVYSLELPYKAYSTMPESIQKTIGDTLREGCKVKLLWDDNFLYIGAVFEDSDVVNLGKNDQEMLYSTGDLLEVFLKPEQVSYYWEIYGSCNNLKTWLFYPSRGWVGLPDANKYKPDAFMAAATVDGTLNKWQDRDTGWTLEIAIPVKALTVNGDKFDNSANWTILLARYNYSRYLPLKELSAFPKMSNVNWHIYEEYARLILEK